MQNYTCDKTKIRETIAQFGVAIVPDVLNASEIAEMQTGMFDTLEHITQKFETPIDRTNPKTFVEMFKLYPSHGMLFQHWQIGHNQFVWNLRQNPKVVDLFATIWDTKPENLLTSFDGASFHLPSEITKRGNFGGFWYHTDQSYTRPEFECVQSWVTGFDVNEGDATLAFIEGSHKFHDEFRQQFKVTDKSDWYPVKDKQLEFYKEKGLKEQKIVCPAGSIVLWDSRVIHCGVPQMKTREKPNFRCVVYICMTPRDRCTEANLRKKQQAFEDLRMTSHWPHKPKLFPINPQTYGKALPETVGFTHPDLTDLGSKLAGF
jgi:hypothetical protein